MNTEKTPSVDSVAAGACVGLPFPFITTRFGWSGVALVGVLSDAAAFAMAAACRRVVLPSDMMGSYEW